MENAEDDSYVCYLAGQLTGERNDIFRQDIECFFKKYGDVRVIFDCSTLTWIDMEGIRVFADLKASGRRFVLKSLNADCTVLFSVEGFEAYLEENDRLPEIDLRCRFEGEKNPCRQISFPGYRGKRYRRWKSRHYIERGGKQCSIQQRAEKKYQSLHSEQ